MGFSYAYGFTGMSLALGLKNGLCADMGQKWKLGADMGLENGLYADMGHKLKLGADMGLKFDKARIWV